MKAFIKIPDNFSGQIELTSTSADDIILSLPSNFYGSVDVNTEINKITIRGKTSSVEEYGNSSTYVADTGHRAYALNNGIKRRWFTTATSFFTDQKKILLILCLLLSMLYSQDLRVLEKTLKMVEIKVDLKILEEMRHSHIQCLIERRYIK